MADTRFVGNKNVDAWWIAEGDYVNADSPTATEINTNGVRLTEAIAWDGTSFPAASDSDEQSDLGLWDDANATTRGAASFDASINYFYPKDLNDTATDYGKVYQEFRKVGMRGILVTRITQLSATGVLTPAAAGQWISVYKSITDGFGLDLEGDDSYKYNITYLPQGLVRVNTQVATGGAITVTRLNGSAALEAGDYAVLKAVMGSHYATQVVSWSSSNSAIASVSQNGVVTAVADGTATITASHPAATAGTFEITVGE